MGGGRPFSIAIGADNWIEGAAPLATTTPTVFLDGAPVPAVALRASGPEYAVRWIAYLPVMDSLEHTLEVRVHESNSSPTNNNTGLYINGWSPTICIVTSG